ncbi:hypothetical protein ACKWTF_015919 [Chironomus riparius]
MMKITLFFIISTTLVITNGAPQHDYHTKDQNLAYKLGIRTTKGSFKDHSNESSEEQSVESDEHHRNHDNYEDSHEGSDESESSSLEHKIENLNKHLNKKMNRITASNIAKGKEAASKGNTDSQNRNTESSHVESKPIENENFNSIKPNEDMKGPNGAENSKITPQDQVTEDVFSILGQTTSRQRKDKDLLDPRITKHLNQGHIPSRKRRHIFGDGFRYRYTIYHYIVPQDYDYGHIYHVPLHTSYSYVPFTPSPIPRTLRPTPPCHHGHHGSNGSSDENNGRPGWTTTNRPDENAVIPLATTQSPINIKPTESFFEEPDTTEYPQDVLKVTEAPDTTDTTDNIFINLFGTE